MKVAAFISAPRFKPSAPCQRRKSMHDSITPEIYEALRTTRAVEFRLASENLATDEELRAELAAELLAASEALPAGLASVTVSVASDLAAEGADFDDWAAR